MPGELDRAAAAVAVLGRAGGLLARRAAQARGQPAPESAQPGSVRLSPRAPLARKLGSPRAGKGLAAARGHLARAAEVLEHAVQPAPLDPLHGVVAQPADLADVEDRHDVRVVQPGGGAGLVQEPPPGRRVGRRVDAQHLERHRPVEPHVHGLVDRPHSAATQLAHDPVAGDPPARLDPVIEPSAAPAPEPVAEPSPSRPWTSSRPSRAARRSSSRSGYRAANSRGPAAAPARSEHVRLDRLAHAIVLVARIGDDVAVDPAQRRQWDSPSLNLRGPPGGPSSERFRRFSPAP